MSKLGLFLLIPFLLTACSNNSIVYSGGWQPNSLYTIDTSTESDSEIIVKPQYSLEQKAGKFLRLKGVDRMRQLVETGVKQKDSSYSVSMKMLKNRKFRLDAQGQSIETPDSRSMEGMVIGAKVKSTGDFELISIEGGDDSPEMHEFFRAIFDQLLNSDHLKDQQLEVGEEVLVSVPMEVPTPVGMAISLEMKTTYTLTKVLSNIAYINMVISADLNVEDQGLGINMAITGNGVLEYNLQDKYSPYFQTTSETHFKLPYRGDVIESKITSKTIMLTSYEENPIQ